MKLMINKAIFKAYDIRGRYPEEINEKIAARIAYALGRYFFKSKANLRPELRSREGQKSKVVMVGHDARLSSPALYETMVRVMCQVSGVKIVEAGMITTPMLYFLVNHFKAIGGIIITASHNPKEYNGLKIVGPKAAPISGKEILSMVKGKM